MTTPTFNHIEYLLSAVTEDGDYPQAVKFARDEYTSLKQRAAELERQLTGAARVVTTLTAERDEARLELQHIRTMLGRHTRRE